MKSTKASDENFVAKQEELAAVLGVDRRTITNIIRRYPKLLPGKKRGAESDGRYNVAAWRALIDQLGIRGRGANNPDINFSDERELRLREWKLKLERQEFELQKTKGLYLPIAQFESALGRMLAKFIAALNALPSRASGKLLPRARAAVVLAAKNALDADTFRALDSALAKISIDYADIEETLLHEIDLVKRTLAKCDYLSPADQNTEPPADA